MTFHDEEFRPDIAFSDDRRVLLDYVRVHTLDNVADRRSRQMFEEVIRMDRQSQQLLRAERSVQYKQCHF